VAHGFPALGSDLLLAGVQQAVGEAILARRRARRRG
jgi:hypothetical protein